MTHRRTEVCVWLICDMDSDDLKRALMDGLPCPTIRSSGIGERYIRWEIMDDVPQAVVRVLSRLSAVCDQTSPRPTLISLDANAIG